MQLVVKNVIGELSTDGRRFIPYMTPQTRDFYQEGKVIGIIYDDYETSASQRQRKAKQSYGSKQSAAEEVLRRQAQQKAAREKYKPWWSAGGVPFKSYFSEAWDGAYTNANRNEAMENLTKMSQAELDAHIDAYVKEMSSTIAGRFGTRKK